MAEPTTSDVARDGDGHPAAAPHRRPRWVTATMVVVGVVVLIVVVMKVTGASVGGHGPGLHGDNQEIRHRAPAGSDRGP